MVHLILASTKGNQGIRYFPYSGYLGLTSLKVEGVVRTKLDADLKPLPAKSVTISVRCYEARLGRLGVMHSNILVDYTQVLWSNPDDEHDYADIGDMEFPFRISIPAKVAGFSTASYVEYRCTWRVEAIINHVPIVGVGSRRIKHSELPLLRFGLPPAYQPSTPIARPMLNSETSQPHSPPIRYCVNSPMTPVGPLDLVSIPIHLLPSDPAVSFRSASVIIERRMQFMEPASPPSTPTLPSSASPISHSLPTSHSHPASSLPIPQRTSSSSSSLSYSPSSSYQESPSVASSSTLIPSEPRSLIGTSTLLVNSIAGTESSGLFAQGADGVWSKTLTLQWPAAKSHSRWAIGETIQSELVSVRFIVRVKIVVSSPSGTDSLELGEKELLVVSTNEAERQLALSKYNDAAHSNYPDGTRSKSKSPRRSRRLHDEVPPVPASASRAEHSHRVSASGPYPPPSSSSKPLRRPHTSAGLRETSRKAEAGSGSVSGPEAERKGDNGGERDSFHRRRGPRPDTGDAEIAASHSASKGYFNAPLKITTANSGGSASSTSLSATSHSSGSNQSDEVREWEEELARIEMRSRRSSDLVGFANKRRRPSDAR
ncbi:hypothetical protein B0H10DRAFT_1982310 [Mycena sp. CBHHK59/15]|nr:hypothetical protein B0H10DRAFT_1982310 [Mycena sp. CBHHK59/15]